MRVVGAVVALTVLALSGCTTAASNGDVKSLSGVWQGILTGRELNAGSGEPAENITMVIADDGTWTATRGTERWKGTVRAVQGGYEFTGTTGGRPVAFLLNRYGPDGLSGPGMTDHQGRRMWVTANLRAVPGGSDASPSALPSSAPPFGGPAGPPPELRMQAP